MTAFYGLMCDTMKHTKNTTSESRLYDVHLTIALMVFFNTEYVLVGLKQ